jgi:hypothetical protein
MSRLFRYEVDEAGLVEGIFEFVTEPDAAIRNALPIVHEVREGPNMLIPWELLESMVLDGVDRREDVADLVHYAVGRLD